MSGKDKEIDDEESDDPAADAFDDSDDEQEPSAPPATQTPAPAVATAPPQAQAPISASPVQATPDINAAAIPQTPVADGKQEPIVISGNLPPAVNAMQRVGENLAFADDLHHGRIEPKTYHDLYASKDTLGKIGTLFGLLVSGAGSGLAHQSNAVLDMMNKEIERDLEAQKTNQSNKQNWYHLAMAHEKQLGDIAAQQAGTAATRMNTYKQGLEADKARFHNTITPGLTDMSASTNAYAQMAIGAQQTIQDNINRFAPGAAKMHAQQQLDNVIKPGIIQEIAQKQNVFAQKKAAVEAMNQDQGGAAIPNNPRAPVLDMNAFKKGVQLHDMGVVSPLSISTGDADKIQREAAALELNRGNYANADDSFNRLVSMKNAGQVPAAKTAGALLGGAAKAVTTGIGAIAGSAFGPGGAGAGAIAGNAVSDASSHGLSEFQKLYEAQRNREIEGLKPYMGELAETYMPNFYDVNDNDKLKEAHRKMTQFFATTPAEKNAQTMTRFKLKRSNDFPELPFRAPKKEK